MIYTWGCRAEMEKGHAADGRIEVRWKEREEQTAERRCGSREIGGGDNWG